MPSPDTISEHIRDLRGCDVAENLTLTNGNAWMGQEYGVGFQLVRIKMGTQGEYGGDLLFLCISGKKKGRERLMADFLNFLGETVPHIDNSRGSSCMSWLDTLVRYREIEL